MTGLVVIGAAELARLHARAGRADVLESALQGQQEFARDLAAVLRHALESRGCGKAACASHDTVPPVTAPASAKSGDSAALPVPVLVACRQFAYDKHDEARNLDVAETLHAAGVPSEAIVQAIREGEGGTYMVVLGDDGEEGEPFSPSMPRMAS